MAQKKCPNCGSFDVSTSKSKGVGCSLGAIIIGFIMFIASFGQPAFLILTVIGVILLIVNLIGGGSNEFICDSCKYKWKEPKS